MPQDIPIIGPIVNRIFGTRNERFVRRYLARVEEMNALEPQVRAMTDAQIKGKTAEFRQRMTKGARAMDLLVEAFAVAREAMDRSVGIRNIFNPKYRDQFPADKLTPELRADYQQTMAAMDAAEPRAVFLRHVFGTRLSAASEAAAPIVFGDAAVRKQQHVVLRAQIAGVERLRIDDVERELELLEQPAHVARGHRATVLIPQPNPDRL